MNSPTAITAYVALGANLGDPQATLNAALAALCEMPATTLGPISSLYRTAPVGLRNQPDFVNAVARLQTMLSPLQTLAALFDIEALFGRSRSVPNAPRTLDLDLLLHGETTLNGEHLALPHPRMHLRAFVLVPLLEIAPECAIPGLGPARQFLDGCRDQSVVRIPAVAP